MKPAFNQPTWLALLIILMITASLFIFIGGCTSNQLPIISEVAADSEEEINPGVICQIECAASDPDADELSYVWSASDGVISGEGSTVSWTTPEAPGTYTISVQVTDDRGGETTEQITVYVLEPNQSPTIENLVVTAEHAYLKETTEGYKVLRGKIYHIECIASDPDGDELIFEWSTDGGEISGEGSMVSWTAPSEGREVTIVVITSDGRGGLVTQNMVITVVTCACKLK